MDINNDSKNNIVTFLRDLATNIEHDEVDELNLKHVSEFYILYLFINALKQAYPHETADSAVNAVITCDTLDENESLAESDIMKFLALGWYIYTNS